MVYPGEPIDYALRERGYEREMKLLEKVKLISKKLEILESLCNKYNLKSLVQPPYVSVGSYSCKTYRFSILQSLSFSQMEELVLNHALEEIGNEY